MLRHARDGGPADSSLCVVSRRHRHPFALRFSSLDSSGHRRSSRIVRAHVHRRDRRSFSARLSPRSIGLHARHHFRWDVETAWSEYEVCVGAALCTDEAPDSGQVEGRIVAVRPVACRKRGSHYARHGSRRHRLVALTFDDGPSSYTHRVLRVLERGRVHATFFLIGDQVGDGAAEERRVLAHDNVVGNHTWDHANVAGDGSFAEGELTRTNSEIRKDLYFDPCLFRAPYGAKSGALVAEAWRLGMKTIQWDVDPQDWSRPGTDAIYSRVTSAVRPGSIVLMHDGGGPRDETVAALPRIISKLRSRGYRFATVPRLLGLQVVYGRP